METPVVFFRDKSMVNSALILKKHKGVPHQNHEKQYNLNLLSIHADR